MATVASLFVKFATDQAQIANDLRKVQRQYENTFRSIKQLAAAYLSFASVKGFADIIHQQMEVIDQNAKVARSFGITYDSLVKMKMIAKEDGVEIEKLTGSMGKMSKTIFDAAKGGVSQSSVFKAIGIDIKDLLNLDPAQQFEIIAASLSKIENPTVRLGAAMEIFGKSARDILNLFDDFPDKMKSAEEFTKKFGITLGEINPRQVEEANDALGRIRLAVEGITGKIGVELSPIVRDLANQFIDSAAGAEIWSDRTRVAIDVVAWSLDRVGVLTKTLGTAWHQTTNIIAGGIATLTAAMGGEGHLIKNIGRQTVDAIDNQSDKFWESDFNSLQKFVDASRAASQARVDAFRGGNTGNGNAAAQIFEDAEKAANFAEKSAREFERFLKSGVFNDPSWAGGIIRGMREVGDSIRNVSEISENLITNSFIILEDAFVYLGMTGKMNMKDMVNSILSDLVRMQVRQNITTPLFNAFQGMGIPNMLSGLFGGFRANGGPVSGSSAYLVGERGPELFMPGRSGSIAPNEALGGSKVTVNIINNAGAQVQTRQGRSAGGGVSLDVVIDQMMAAAVTDTQSRTSNALKTIMGVRPQLPGR